MEELVRNWPGADGGEGISKLFQHSISLLVNFSFGVSTNVKITAALLRVFVGDEVDAAGRSEERNSL